MEGLEAVRDDAPVDWFGVACLQLLASIICISHTSASVFPIPIILILVDPSPLGSRKHSFAFHLISFHFDTPALFNTASLFFPYLIPDMSHSS